MTEPSIRPIPAFRTHSLRHSVLRPHQSIHEMVFEDDDDPRAGHFGAFDDGEMVAVASVLPQGAAGEWRVRGMATEPRRRSRGLGGSLLAACVAHAAGHEATLVWCNVRRAAIGFYSRHGFIVEGEEFELPDIGPHVKMVLRLTR